MKELMKLFHRDEWQDFNKVMVGFGQSICSAKKPLCQKCPINDVCRSPLNFMKKNKKKIQKKKENEENIKDKKNDDKEEEDTEISDLKNLKPLKKRKKKIEIKLEEE
jgi:adenine-specific DNA glycosylase